MPSASAYGSPSSSGTAPAMPLARKATTLSRCQPARSSRSTTAILVSKRTGSVMGPSAPPPATCRRARTTLGRCGGAVSDVPDPARVERVRAWRPSVPGVSEVLHARFVAHAYPAHTHDEWTLLLVDSGAVRYDLGRREHGALAGQVTVLPPHVAHTGRAVGDAGFRKRVVYVEPSLVPPELTGRAVDGPALPDPLLAHRVGQLHRALAARGEEMEAESRLALVLGRVADHLRSRPAGAAAPARRAVPEDLRDLLDATMAEGLPLRTAADLLGVHPDSLVRAFSRAFGLPPHQYVIGRRVDAARHRLLAGEPPAEVATVVGFCDQAHLTRHFRRVLGTSPARYARSRA